MTTKQPKQIKLQPKQSPRARHQYKTVPELKISGVWLEEQGFYAGQTVEITIHNQELTIKPKAQ